MPAPLPCRGGGVLGYGVPEQHSDMQAPLAAIVPLLVLGDPACLGSMGGGVDRVTHLPTSIRPEGIMEAPLCA